jgi:hypothetical protein
MKVGRLGLKLSSGKIIHFKSKAKRERFENFARAYKHGFRPTRKGK